MRQIAAAVRRLAPIAQSRGVAVILNDRPDLASALGCDGVHVGQYGRLGGLGASDHGQGAR